MIKVSQQLIDHIEQVYNLEITQATPINQVLKISTDKKAYILKRVRNKHIMEIYNFLLAQKFTHFVVPIQTINHQLFTLYNQQLYYLVPYYHDIEYPTEKKLIDYIELLNELHKRTTIRKRFNRSQFNRLYKKKLKRLERQFQLLDLYVVECENKKYKSIFDWTYLVKYNEIMYVKNVLLKLQSQIDDLTEEMDNYDYCIIHNNPNIDHFIVTNERNYLISFDYSTIGFKVHDYIKLFIDYSEYDVDWMMLMTTEKISKFEFYYFIFNVLYYMIKNIPITYLSKNNQYESNNILLSNLYVSAKAVDLHHKIESLNSSAEEQE